MATLNLSSEGPSITKSYQNVVSAAWPTGSPAAASPTYAQWAVYSVAAPLVSAFQQDAGKESVLKVQSTGEGELVDLIDDFSDGKIQFAFVKVKDPNTKLAKSVLIAWCGEGVPERTKGYFTSHLAAVAQLLRGYHVQITARSDSDLTPESIVRKVADASGSKYSGDTAPSAGAPRPPPVASKPVFTPTQVGGSSSSFNPLGPRTRAAPQRQEHTDEDGWGADAPPVTRTQLEKVAPAYKPTTVNMQELTSQNSEPSRFNAPIESANGQENVVKGAYQPIGKVDIAAIRREAQQTGSSKDDRPAPVKGSYEPVGKVDIAAIRARAQPSAVPTSPPPSASPARTGGAAVELDDSSEPRSLADRTAAFTQSERITSLPKPKVASRFGSTPGSFAGTKAPLPGGFDGRPVATAAPVGVASKNFADEGGKTPAQLWAEKKARERGNSGAADSTRPAGTTAPIASQQSGGSQWNAGYAGKKWAPVQITKTGQSATSAASQEREDEQEDTYEDAPPSGGVSAIRDRFKDAAPMGAPTAGVRGGFDDEEDAAAPPPPMHLASKPNAGARIPGLPPQQEAEEEEPEPVTPREDTPPNAPSGSPIRVAMPVGRGRHAEAEPDEEVEEEAPPMPARSMAQMVPPAHELEDETETQAEDPARGAARAAAETSFGAQSVAEAAPGAHAAGKRALIQYDYEKAEDNELELKEGEYVTNIDMVDEDWWMGQNSSGETGLFPANYVELVDDDEPGVPAPSSAQRSVPPAPVAGAAKAGPTATAQFDYEAAEDNEISFPDGATITSLEFPDEDWWLGEYDGKKGLFPANYVQLDG